MKSKSLFLLVSIAMILGMVAAVPIPSLADTLSQQEPPLRLVEPTAGIVADLEEYIPEYMVVKNIPGVAIALIRDGEIVWTEGFGVANAFTRRPVTPQTPFEVASNSKPVAAYIALQLVDQGRLSLDEPLNAYLPEPWLPDSEYRDAITLRQVLSHSSGLGQIGRESLFAPGRGYHYSPSGYHYLQAVIEQVTGRSLEDLAQEMVFTPLGMTSSSYVNPTALTPRTANGHTHAFIPALLFTFPFITALVLVGLIGLLILRIRMGRWRPTWRNVIGTCAVAFLLALLTTFILLDAISLPEYAWLSVACGLVLVGVFALVYLAIRAVIFRLPPERAGKSTALAIVLSLLILVALAYSQANVNLPLPKWPATQADAAGSLRATVGDMATFLIELSDPRYLSPELAAQLGTPQVSLSDDLSWGLGPGIQHSEQGDALWQWGQHFDFQSVMIIYPEYGFGVVVCTNTDVLNSEVAIEIAHRALGGKIEPIRRATHLEFNYSAGD